MDGHLRIGECLHCGKAVQRIAAGWVDEAGFFNCAKRRPHWVVEVADDGR